MSDGPVTLVVALAAGALLGIPAWRRSSGHSPALRLVLALAPLLGAALLWIVVGFVQAVEHHSYSAARLALSACLLGGDVLYPPADSGVLLSAIYGPVSVLAYLPAALFRDPIHALVAGVLTNQLWFLGSLVVLFQVGARGKRGVALALAVWTASLLLTGEAMRQVLGSVHVDGIAIALGALSCAVLLGSGAPSQRRLALAALLVVGAAWTKQVETPAALGQLLWLLVARGRRSALAYLGWLTAAALASILVVSLAFGFREVWLNVVEIPGSHPLYALRPLGLEWARMSLPAAAVLAFGAWAEEDERPGRVPAARDWGLPFLVFVFLVPTSLYGRAKMGGFLNSWHCQYFLVAAAGLALRGALLRPRARAASEAVRTVATALLAVGLLGYLPWRRTLVAYLDEGKPAGTRELHEVARSMPGRVLFPWNPLVTWTTDRRLYHFEWGVRDRDLAGYRPDDAHVRAHVPEDLELIVYPRSIAERRTDQPKLILLEYLPEFREMVDVPGHPSLVGFRRPEREAPLR